MTLCDLKWPLRSHTVSLKISVFAMFTFIQSFDKIISKKIKWEQNLKTKIDTFQIGNIKLSKIIIFHLSTKYMELYSVLNPGKHRPYLGVIAASSILPDNLCFILLIGDWPRSEAAAGVLEAVAGGGSIGAGVLGGRGGAMKLPSWSPVLVKHTSSYILNYKENLVFFSI